ncbi:unannotated protein [freshwater metagenome]|uniref:Unannotated protein n=1 Tax=freshwater metagenome TaxID=449393 RepID=A0A6J7SQP8_9ZZZZ
MIAPPLFALIVDVIAVFTCTLCVAPVVIEILGGATTVKVNVAVDVPPAGPVAVSV